MNGAELAVRQLHDFGVERVFTLCGNGLDPFLVACAQTGIDLIDTHNEQAAAYMADAHGRLTRRIGVCAVSSGVAHANALTGVVNAYFDGSPMLLITGASDQATLGWGHFQQLDQVGLARPVCKLARRVGNPRLVGEAVAEALTVATAARPGPVHLTIPIDVFKAEVEEVDVPRTGGAKTTRTVSRGDPDRVAAAGALLAQAKRPVLVAGSGVFYAYGEEAVTRFAAVAGIPIVVPIWDRGCIGRPCREFAGLVGAASGQPRLLADADLIILVGARADYRVGYLRPPAVGQDVRVIRISADARELCQGRQADVAILGDAGSVLEELTERVRQGHKAWLAEALGRAQEFRARWSHSPPQSGSRMTGRHLVELLRPFITDETIFLIDGGDIGQWAHMLLADRYPGHWLTCGASGVVGWGLPGAIAAKLAYPQRPVLLLSGDGAAGFTIAELEVAVRRKAPIVMVIADDEAWGIVVAGQRRTYGRTTASELGPTRYDLVAEGFGAGGVRTADPGELSAAVREALSSDRPTVIQVPLEVHSPTNRRVFE